MRFRILKRDLKQKKSMNLILLVFVLLATMFISASLNAFQVIANGLEYYFEKAQIGDYMITTMWGDGKTHTDNNVKLEHFLDGQKNVTRYEEDIGLMITEDCIMDSRGKHLKMSGTGFINSYSIRQQKFFDSENREITSLEDGEVYITKKTVVNNDLKPGDHITICTETGYKKEFRVMGYMKDALFGSDLMGSDRFVISVSDYASMMEGSDLSKCCLYSVLCDDIEAFEAEYSECNFNVLFDADRRLLRMTYIMDLVIAAVFLMVSICLVLIAVVMLRFSIIFTINEDYREIGIMKAIGISNQYVRTLYLSKYFALSVVGVLIGMFASVPFSRKLLASAVENIVVKDDGGGVFFGGLTGVVMVFVVTLFAYFSTGRVRKLTPMDAIRRGNKGERFQKKAILKLRNFKLRATTFMAVNDVLSEKRKYLVLLATGMMGIWLVIMPANTVNTLQSEDIGQWFGLTKSDFFVSDGVRALELLTAGQRESYVTYMNEIEQRLEDGGLEVRQVLMEVMFRLQATNGEYSCHSLSLQGLGTDTSEYSYSRGKPPILENEVALTHVVADKLHADIGDTIYIAIGEEERPFLVTAIYQSMNNMGDGIRFPEKTELDYASVAGLLGVQVRLEQTELKEDDIIRKAEKIMPEAKIKTMRGFLDEMLGGLSDKLQSVKILILIVVIIINLLVVVLMQKMFLLREQGEVGMLKAIGFADRAIIGWQTKRVMLVLLLGILLGTATATPFSQFTSGQVFKMMGASRITFQIHPVEIYGIYPGVLYVSTVLGCIITMLRVRRVSPQTINEVE